MFANIANKYVFKTTKTIHIILNANAQRSLWKNKNKDQRPDFYIISFQCVKLET